MGSDFHPTILLSLIITLCEVKLGEEPFQFSFVPFEEVGQLWKDNKPEQKQIMIKTQQNRTEELIHTEESLQWEEK